MNSPSNHTALGETMRINRGTDVVDVRTKIRELCKKLDFSLAETTRVVTATSELARNMIEFAGSGEARWEIFDGRKSSYDRKGKIGVKIVFEDEGPGIENIDWAMQDGASTGKGLGKGLPGSEKLMDDMEVETEPGEGTKITIIKWRNKK